VAHVLKLPDGRSFDRDRSPLVTARHCLVHFVNGTVQLLFLRDDGQTVESVAFVEIEKPRFPVFVAAMRELVKRGEASLPPLVDRTPHHGP
jgi:hypothetical protein